MKVYINKNDVEYLLKQHLKNWCGPEYYTCNIILDEIHNMSYADVKEIVYGHWIVCGDGEYVPFMCSACGKTTSWYHAQTANYCPNCGATMSKEG